METTRVEPKIINQPTALDWNVEECKTKLLEMTEKYKNLVVTDDNVEDMSKTLRELVHIRTQFNKFVKAGKDALRVPQNVFKTQCESLALVIEDVELPLRKQLEKYENQRVARLTQDIEGEIEKKGAALGIESSYMGQFQMNQKWFNKTAKWSDTCIAIDAELNRLLAIQNQEKQAVQMKKMKADLISAYIDSMVLKHGLKTPLVINKRMFLDSEKDIEEVKASIDEIATYQKIAENRAAEEKVEKLSEQPKEKNENELPKELSPEPVHPSEPPASDYVVPEKVTLVAKIRGTYAECERVQDELRMMYGENVSFEFI